jgi:hypothetical protein
MDKRCLQGGQDTHLIPGLETCNNINDDYCYVWLKTFRLIGVWQAAHMLPMHNSAPAECQAGQ